jgi:hypothetical protein
MPEIREPAREPDCIEAFCAFTWWILRAIASVCFKSADRMRANVNVNDCRLIEGEPRETVFRFAAFSPGLSGDGVASGMARRA